jgi:hypothetical protein
MRRSALLLLAAAIAIANAAAAGQAVSFFQDSVLDIDGRVIKMLGGSVWLMDSEILALPLDDAVVLFAGHDSLVESEDIKARTTDLPKQGLLHYQGSEVAVTLVSGIFLRRNGYLGTVVEAHGDGGVLELDDGSLWSVPSYDQYDSGYWLPPYRVIVYSNELYMLNLKKGKRIWVQRIRR